jgi:hypothetical protein
MTITELFPPPDPDSTLTEGERAIWCKTVGSKPRDWFKPESLELLTAYCKHASRARYFDDLIERTGPEDLDQLGKLAGMREKETRAVLALARSMRLTHQAQHRADSKKTNTSGLPPRPWEHTDGAAQDLHNYRASDNEPGDNTE